MENVRFNGPEDDETKKSHESDDDDDEKDKPKRRVPSKSLFGLENEERPKKVLFEADEKPKTTIFEKIIEPDVQQSIEEAKDDIKDPEVVSDSEAVDAAKQFVEVGISDAASELDSTDIGSANEAEAAAGLAFNKALQNNLENSDSVEAAIEQAAQETVEELDLEPDTSEQSLESPEEYRVDPEIEDGIEDPDDDSTQLTPPVPPSPPAPPVNPNIPPQPPNPPTPPPVQPPNPPGPPGPNPGGPGGNAPGGNTPPVGPNMNAAPFVGANPNNDPTEVNIIQRRHRAGDLLLGGIVGYMIGRRGGRIRTEKRLIPVQKKLEKQVTDLQNRITQQELAVRRQARAQHEKLLSLPQTRRTDEKQERRQQKIKELRENPISVLKKAENSPIEEQSISSFEKPETTTVTVADKLQEKFETVERTKPTDIDNIPLPLLLEIAADIKLGGVSLRTMYERGSVSQKQLREVIKGYSRGDKLEKIWPEVIKQDLATTEASHEIVSYEDESKEASDKQDSDRDLSEHDFELRTASSVSSSEQPIISPIVRSIIDETDKSPVRSPIPPIVMLTLAIVVAVIIITLFT